MGWGNMGYDHRRSSHSETIQNPDHASAGSSPGKRTLTEGLVVRQAEVAPSAEAEADAEAGAEADAEAGAEASAEEAGDGGGPAAVVNAGASSGDVTRESGAIGPLAGNILGRNPIGGGVGLGAAIGRVAHEPTIARQPRRRGGRRRARPRAHPTSISSTTTYGATLNYGKHYMHTFVSSTGNVADLNNINVGERITVARDDFGLGWGGVPMGALSARVNRAGQWGDEIGTPAAGIHPRMASVRSLPAVLDTPQDLYWQDASGRWNHFCSVAITFTVRRAASGGLEAVTVDNGVPFSETFTGPAPGSGSSGSGGGSGGTP